MAFSKQYNQKPTLLLLVLALTRTVSLICRLFPMARGTPLLTKIQDSRRHVQNTQRDVKKISQKRKTTKMQPKKNNLETNHLTLNHSSTSHFEGPCSNNTRDTRFLDIHSAGYCSLYATRSTQNSVYRVINRKY